MQCAQCEAVHTITQSISDPLPTDCPDCGQPELKQLISGISTVACTGLDVAKRAKEMSQKDIKRIKKGRDKDLIDVAGDKPNQLKK